MSFIDAAGRYIKLKKQGRNYFGICPFHEEKTPSFSIDPQTGLWICWGCGAKGNIYHLIEKMESVDFPEAVEIGKGYGVEPPDNFTEKTKKESVGLEEKNPVRNAYEAGDYAYKENAMNKEQVLEFGTEEPPGEEEIAPDTKGVRKAEKPAKPIPKPQAKKNPPKTDKEIEKKTATYVYDDENGKILYEKEKWERFKGEERTSKRFAFYSYEGAKRVVGKGNNKLILYNLKDVLSCETVFICEGEKDADTLKSVWPDKNTAFTTNATGAESWEDSYDIYFKEKNIVVLEDNDEAGRRRSEKLKTAVEPAAKSFKIIKFEELDEHGDVSDYLEKFSLEELIVKIDSAERKADKPELVRLNVFELKVYVDKTDYMLPNFIPLKRGKANTVSGATLEFLIYISLVLSKKFNVVFLSGYDAESLTPYFSNIIKRIAQPERVDVKDISIGNISSDVREADIIIATQYVDKKGFTVVCPQSGQDFPDYYFKNGDIFDKFWKKVLKIENLKGAGEIKIVKQKEKAKLPLRFSIFKK
ncbi:MAG: CHC2 zinc finger domain-containing protein [bacterium]